MHRILIFLILVFLSAGLFAQDTCRVLSTAQENLNYLHNGTLLVRLHTRKPSIDALKAKGLITQAEKLRNLQSRENIELIAAFKSRYEFSKVLFFFNTDSDLLLDGDLDQIGFLDDSLKVDPNILFPSTGYLIAELTYVQQDTSNPEQFKTHSHEKDVQESGYVGGAYGGFHALIIKDQCLNQLKKPFPFYSRTWKSLGVLDMEDVVKKLNRKLFNRF